MRRQTVVAVATWCLMLLAEKFELAVLVATILLVELVELVEEMVVETEAFPPA